MTDPLRLLCVFAHPDDETFGAGGLLAHYRAQGVETYLICATRGERGWDVAAHRRTVVEAGRRHRTPRDDYAPFLALPDAAQVTLYRVCSLVNGGRNVEADLVRGAARITPPAVVLRRGQHHPGQGRMRWGQDERKRA